MAPRTAAGGTPAAPETAALDSTTDAVLLASRALVGIAVRSLEPVSITLQQFRALVLLAQHGPQNVGGLAELLGIHPSTATRLCDRLLALGHIERATSRESRREVTVVLSARGRALVRKVTARRREEIRAVVAGLSAAQRADLVSGMQAFAAATGELPDDAWKLGWTT
jgi:DNA-binding MarR family transcriptional regulator